jgi:hypothetical protein
VDRAAGLGVAQDPEVVDERRRALVGGPMELDEDALDLQEIALQGIQEAAGLQVFRGGTAVNQIHFFRTEEQRVSASFRWNRTRLRTYTEIPSSLMIYPIPYPSAATGPNPNNLSAGLPQFDVDKMDMPSCAHPGSVKIAGILVILCSGAVFDSGDGAVIPFGCDSGLFKSCRWTRQ